MSFLQPPSELVPLNVLTEWTEVVLTFLQVWVETLLTLLAIDSM